MNINYELNSIPMNNDLRLREMVSSIVDNAFIYENSNVKEFDEELLNKIYNSFVNYKTPIKQKFISVLAYKLVEKSLESLQTIETKNLEKKLCYFYTLLEDTNNLINSPVGLNISTTHLGLATLMYIKSQGHINLIDFLLDKGARVRHEGSQALLMATKTNHEELVEKYLNLGANPTNSRGDIISYALTHGSFNILEKFRLNQKCESIEDLVFKNKENVIYSVRKIIFSISHQNIEKEKNPKILLNALLSSTKKIDIFNIEKERYMLENTIKDKVEVVKKKMKI